MAPRKTAGRKAAAKAPAKLEAVAERGVRLNTLRTLRNRLARDIDGSTSPRDTAALCRQLTLVLAEITALSPAPAKKGNPLSELDKKRAARGADTARAPRAAGGQSGRRR